MSTDKERREVYASRRWRRLRSKKLHQSPLCEHCERMGLTVNADVVHHIVPVRKGGDLFPDLDGLESLCNRCHSIHHNMSDEQKKFFELLKSMN